MRKAVFSALMIILAVLFCACTGTARNEEKITQFRSALNDSTMVSFSANMKVDDGDCVSEYEFACVKSGDEIEINLLEPQLIAGVSAKISEKNAEISYDGLSFAIGTVSENGLTPIEALPVILDALSRGVAGEIRTENRDGTECLIFSVERGEGISVALCLCADTMIPIQAEILSTGREVICCAISDWVME